MTHMEILIVVGIGACVLRFFSWLRDYLYWRHIAPDIFTADMFAVDEDGDDAA